MADLDRLSPQARAMLDKLLAAGLIRPEQLTSGYRDPAYNEKVGGAKGSQHIHGNAIDISTAGMDDAARRKLLEAAIANGARGVGIYPGGSLHFDVRESPAFWGPAGYRGSPASAAPEWGRDLIAKLTGTSAVGTPGDVKKLPSEPQPTPVPPFPGLVAMAQGPAAGALSPPQTGGASSPTTPPAAGSFAGLLGSGSSQAQSLGVPVSGGSGGTDLWRASASAKEPASMRKKWKTDMLSISGAVPGLLGVT